MKQKTVYPASYLTGYGTSYAPERLTVAGKSRIWIRQSRLIDCKRFLLTLACIRPGLMRRRCCSRAELHLSNDDQRAALRLPKTLCDTSRARVCLQFRPSNESPFNGARYAGTHG